MTLNGVIKVIQDFGEKHLLIKTVHNGSVIERLAEGEIVYPCMTFDTTTATVNASSILYTFQFFFFDRLMIDKINERDVHNDQLEICKDIIAQLGYPGNEFTLGDTVNIQFFTDSTPELLAGVSATMTIDTPFASDRCVIPSTVTY